MTREFKKCGNINIPLNWEYRPIKTIIRGISDGTHGTFERVGDGYPLLSAKNVFDDGIHIGDNESQISEEAFNEITANGYPHKDDILLCCVGTIGRSTIYPYEKPMAFQRSVIFLTLNQYLMLPEMMHYLLMSDDVKAQENNLINQSAQAGLYQGSVKQIRVVVPPLTEQKEIIRFLNSSCHRIDNAISRHQQIIEKLEEYRKSVITQAVTKGLDTDVKMKYSGNKYTGNIPTSWDFCKTLYILDMPVTDGPHETPTAVNNGVPFISAEAVSVGNGHIDFSHKWGDISEEYYLECCKKYIPKLHDIYMIKSGATTGKVACVETNEKFTIWSPLAVIRVNPNKMLYQYMYYFLQSDGYQRQVELGWTYGTQQNIGMRTIEKLKVCVPPLSEQKHIASYLDSVCGSIDESIIQHRHLIDKLNEYKQSLIYNAVTGKIDCRATE